MNGHRSLPSRDGIVGQGSVSLSLRKVLLVEAEA